MLRRSAYQKLTLKTDFATPVLLQQLLQSMEDSRAPRSNAIIFAVLSLLVRLIACQSSVFSLWYGRRCYERSRGEMIMMLYEKTLSRKNVGDSMKSQDLNKATSDAKDHLELPKSHVQRKFPIYGKAVNYLKDKFKTRGSVEDPKRPASVGKIFNLMR